MVIQHHLLQVVRRVAGLLMVVPAVLSVLLGQMVSPAYRVSAETQVLALHSQVQVAAVAAVGTGAAAAVAGAAAAADLLILIPVLLQLPIHVVVIWVMARLNFA